MLGLEVPTSIAQGNVSTRLLGLETVAVLIQEASQTREQGPEAKDGSGTHQLVVITAQEVLTVFEEGLNVPTDGQDVNDSLSICIYQGASPVAGLLQGSVRARAGDQYQRSSKIR